MRVACQCGPPQIPNPSAVGDAASSPTARRAEPQRAAADCGGGGTTALRVAREEARDRRTVEIGAHLRRAVLPRRRPSPRRRSCRSPSRRAASRRQPDRAPQWRSRRPARRGSASRELSKARPCDEKPATVPCCGFVLTGRGPDRDPDVEPCALRGEQLERGRGRNDDHRCRRRLADAQRPGRQRRAVEDHHRGAGARRRRDGRLRIRAGRNDRRAARDETEPLPVEERERRATGARSADR